jgi:hypothetical protein
VTRPRSTAAPGTSGEPFEIRLRIDDDDELRALRGALLAARATELSEIQRRAGRLNLGYGSDSARDAMSDEVATLRRRWAMLDRLLAAIDAATQPEDRGGAG